MRKGRFIALAVAAAIAASCAGNHNESGAAEPFVPPVMPQGYSGTWVSYYPDGSMEAVREMKNGEISGAVTEYYRNGHIREKYTSIGGKLQGQYLRFHPNGDAESSATYKNGLLDGLLTQYYESGNLVRSTQMYASGKRDGIFTLFYRDGMKKAQFTYKGDQYYGEILTYYPNGQIIVSMNSPVNGRVRFFYQNGQLEAEYFLHDNVVDGKYAGYYPTGQVKRKGQYSHGNMTGTWYFYDKDGRESVTVY